MNSKKRSLGGILLAFNLMAAACGGGSDAAADGDTAVLADDSAVLSDDAGAEIVEDDVETEVDEETAAEAPEEFDMVAAVNAYTSAIPEGFMAIKDVTAFKDAVEASSALVIDVREASEYAEGHIGGAVNIPIRTLAQSIDKIPTDTQVFVYCASGFRAGMATSSLRLLGYDNVLAYAPGWAGWTAAAEPVSTDAAEAEVVGAPEVAPEMLDAVDGFLSTIPEGWLSAGDAAKVTEAMDVGAFILDVRTAAENAEGQIPGATNVPLRTLPLNLDQIPTDTQVISYCSSGFRAALSIPVLHVLGHTNVKGFPGSWNAWTEAGLEVEAP